MQNDDFKDFHRRVTSVHRLDPNVVKTVRKCITRQAGQIPMNRSVFVNGLRPTLDFTERHREDIPGEGGTRRGLHVKVNPFRVFNGVGVRKADQNARGVDGRGHFRGRSV